MDANVLAAALRCARAVFGDASITATTTLRDRRGWSVERLTLSTGAGNRSVIAKTAQARERAALEVLTSADVPLLPRLLAVCDDPALVLMEDAGSGPSVADRLLGDDPDEAAAAVRRWAGALARMQAATLGQGAAFHRRLAELAILKPDEGPDVYRARCPRPPGGQGAGGNLQRLGRWPPATEPGMAPGTRWFGLSSRELPRERPGKIRLCGRPASARRRYQGWTACAR